MTRLTLLGGMTPRIFFRDYWHKKPLLIRHAFPGFEPLLSRAELSTLAQQDDVESRLISHSAEGWHLQHGPFKRLPSFRQKAWTLLLQGVNLHDDAADALMQQFRFIPDARLDDLMISYATDGGGVGPHFDSYDVFLLQAHGRRRWQISAQNDLTLIEGMPLKILKNFTPEEEFILNPGDMLYLPPHYAHDGVALGECMTYSIGFRAPAFQELGESFLQFMADSIELPGRYGDPDLRPGKSPAEISGDMLSRIEHELAKVRFTEEDVAIFVGEYLSEPKAQVFFDAPTKPLTVQRFAEKAAKRGIALSRKSRMLYCGKHIFINGEAFVARPADKTALRALASDRRLIGQAVALASDDVRDALYSWYECGWIKLL